MHFYTQGLVLRQCDEDGNWNDTFDITGCSSEGFITLQTMAVSSYMIHAE